jgi:cytochrome c
VAEGETLFRARCAACHSLEPGQSRIGPALVGLAGRTAGAVEGARYSSALRDSGLVWNAETLEAFLANPREAVPGTTMAVSLPNAAQRAAVVDFLLAPTGK